MEDSQPAKSALPKVSIPVEESRAQRLQRSQARFRDRGGIFVPTARNTLVDILLGRKVASPKKGRGRSASLSPKKKSVKSDARNNDEEVKAVRSSPRKAMQRQQPEAGVTERPLSPKKKSVKSDVRSNDEEVKAVRSSPRKAMQRQQPEAGPSNVQSVVSKRKTAKKSVKEAATPATVTSKAKVKEDNEKPATKKRGRKPKTTVEPPAGTLADHNPLPIAEPQPTTKKSQTKRVSKKATKPDEFKGDSLAETTTPEPKRPAKAASKLLDGVTTEDADAKKSSRASTSKKFTASKRKPAASVQSEPAPLQQSSPVAGSSKTKKASVSEDDRRPNEVHQKSSKESANIKGKGKRKAPQNIDQGDKLDVTVVEVPTKSRKKRARPAESEVECPSSPKRVKRTPLEETKSNASRRKAPTAKKETTKKSEEDIPRMSKDALSKSPRSKKRAREPDDEQAGAKRKKTKGVVDANPISDGAVDKQAVKSKEASKANKKAEKAKKPPTSKTSLAKKGTTKASNQDKSLVETNPEPGVVLITRIRPRKSVIIRMKEPEPHEIVNNDPDPINFLS